MRTLRWVTFLAFAGLEAAAADDLLAPPAAVDALRQGGYVLYFRHAATDMTKNDAGMKSFEDCPTQRNLVDRGRDDARAIGAAIKALGIPIGKVRASPYCRTVETAELAFGRAEKTAAVRGSPVRTDDATRYAALRKLLSERPARGTNDVIVSHGNPFHAVAGPPYLAEGEAAVVLPTGDRFRVIARIRVEDWPAAR
ncbi:MAG TPA: histidine phosphatase family protein [Burkholderiales bacterium]|nr:histidine phosphatase family protein [Burkholderiales bacterium]